MVYRYTMTKYIGRGYAVRIKKQQGGRGKYQSADQRRKGVSSRGELPNHL